MLRFVPISFQCLFNSSKPSVQYLVGIPIRSIQQSSISSSKNVKKESSDELARNGPIKVFANTLSNKSETSSSVSNSEQIQDDLNRKRPSKSSSLPKIYTRTGDRGTSVLLSTGAKRLPKDSLVFDVLGTLDELSSVIGIVLSTCSSTSIRNQLENIQYDLFEIGACVAANNASPRFIFNDPKLVENFEKQIDQMTAELPELRNFILPGGGSTTASHVHLARAVCRRSERLMTKWFNQRTEEEKQNQQPTMMGIYLNRLSDYFFTLARYITYKEGHQEITYQKRN